MVKPIASEFTHIKALIQSLLNASPPIPHLRSEVREAILSDSNQQRAEFLIELLDLGNESLSIE